MKNLSKTARIFITDGNHSKPVNYLNNSKTLIDVKKIMSKNPDGCLIKKGHSFVQTQFVLTDTDSCILIYFEDPDLLLGIKVFNSNTKAPVSFFIHQRYVILLPFYKDLHYEKIQTQNIMNQLKTNKL